MSLELPLVVVDIQRGGPSTGLPTKTEQSDLLHAMYGRHGEAPVPIVAARTSSHCFEAAIEAVRIAVKYRTPVFLLSDGSLANGAEPWKLPELSELPEIDPGFADATNHTNEDGTEAFWPYKRDETTLARPWAIPGTAGLEHRIGGLEKEDGTGNVSYDPQNHELMIRLRAAKVAGIAADIPPVWLDDPDGRGGAPLLALGWGSTYGSIQAAVRRVRARGLSVAHAHLVHLNPFPSDLGEVLAAYPRLLVPEANLGQLSRLVRAEFLVDARSLTKVQGVVFRAAEIEQAMLAMLNGEDPPSYAAESEGGADMTDVVVPLTTRKDWTSDQEVRWCPGCGDYSILAAVQMLLPELEVRRETTVFVSGIGCAARFPYYMNTYGMHSIHGRAPAVATGLAVTRPDLDIWVITGDGDSLSIGGNHLIHALRRNVNLTMLLFNNQIYGLTKGQYSPTSEQGKVTKSTPFGSLESPFNPISLALGAEATFVARTHDMDRKHMQETFRRAHDHKGAAFVEVYQNCNVFNDGAFEQVTGKDQRSEMLVPLVHGEPIRFGADNQRGVVADREGKVRVVEVADVGEEALLVHDEKRDDPGLAFQLSRFVAWPVRTDAHRGVQSCRACRLRQLRCKSSSKRPAGARARATSRHCCALPEPGRCRKAEGRSPQSSLSA